MIAMQNETFPGATVFTAALVGDTRAPDLEVRMIVTEGDSYKVRAGHVFDVQDAGGWKTYYAAQDTEVNGPAVMTVPRKNGPREGIFEESWNHKMFMAILNFVIALASLFLLTQTDEMFLIVTWSIVAIGNIIALVAHIVKDKGTKKEQEMNRNHLRQEVFLPPDALAYIRSKSQQE